MNKYIIILYTAYVFNFYYQIITRFSLVLNELYAGLL